jgi:hypothetical protein
MADAQGPRSYRLTPSDELIIEYQAATEYRSRTVFAFSA